MKVHDLNQILYLSLLIIQTKWTNCWKTNSDFARKKSTRTKHTRKSKTRLETWKGARLRPQVRATRSESSLDPCTWTRERNLACVAQHACTVYCNPSPRTAHGKISCSPPVHHHGPRRQRHVFLHDSIVACNPSKDSMIQGDFDFV